MNSLSWPPQMNPFLGSLISVSLNAGGVDSCFSCVSEQSFLYATAKHDFFKRSQCEEYWKHRDMPQHYAFRSFKVMAKSLAYPAGLIANKSQ